MSDYIRIRETDDYGEPTLKGQRQLLRIPGRVGAVLDGGMKKSPIADRVLKRIHRAVGGSSKTKESSMNAEELEKLAQELIEQRTKTASVDFKALSEYFFEKVSSGSKVLKEVSGLISRNRGKVGAGVGVVAGHRMGSRSEAMKRDSYYDKKSDSWKPKTDKHWDRLGNPKTQHAKKYEKGGYTSPFASKNSK